MSEKRHRGKITTWKDEQGFGFITPSAGGPPVFVHIKAFSDRQRRPLANEVVDYDVRVDDQGRLHATEVTFSGQSSLHSRQQSGYFILLPVGFLLLVTAFVFAGRAPLAVLGLYLGASAVTFLTYAHDKAAAKKGQWRTSEGALHALSMIGGWPGAFVAQRVLRHKSRKQAFQVVFWATVVLNIAAALYLLSAGSMEFN